MWHWKPSVISGEDLKLYLKRDSNTGVFLWILRNVYEHNFYYRISPDDYVFTQPWASISPLKPTTLIKVTFLHGCFLRFLNCTNSTQLVQSVSISSTVTEKGTVRYSLPQSYQNSKRWPIEDHYIEPVIYYIKIVIGFQLYVSLWGHSKSTSLGIVEWKLTEKVTKRGIRESVCSKKVLSFTRNVHVLIFFSAVQFSVSVVHETLVLLQWATVRNTSKMLYVSLR